MRLAVESGALRFAKSTPPRWRMWGRGRHTKPRPELHVVFTDSSGKVAAVAKLPPADKKDPPPPEFTASGDTGWPVGLANAAPTDNLLLVRGPEDALAARELFGASCDGLPVAIIAMLADCPLSADALETLRGRVVALMDMGAAEAGFVFGGWRGQLMDAGALTVPALTDRRSAADERVPSLSLSSGLRVAMQTEHKDGAKFDLPHIKTLLRPPCPPTSP